MSADQTAHARLRLALADALDLGLRIPCAGRRGHQWTSDDPDERATAATACDGCPAFTECGAAVDETREKWGVWSGLDRTPATRPKTTTTEQEQSA